MKILNIKEKNALTFNTGIEITYEDREGNIKTWELVTRNNLEKVKRQIEGKERFSSAPVIVASDEKRERLCVIRQFRVTAGKYVYEFPAGLIDEGETVEETARREFKEETGMDLQIERVSPPRYTTVGLTDERCSMVYGTYSGEPSNAYLESTEDITVELADRARIREILEHEDVCVKAALVMEQFLMSEPLA